MLAEHFAINMARELELELFAGFSKKSRDLLLDYNWPGNVRELKNVVERAVYRTPPNVPVHDIIINPFESKFRPQQRTKTKTAARDNIGEVPIMPSTETAPEHTGAAASFGGLTEPTGFEFPMDLKQASQDYEIGMLQQALEDSQYNQKKTAEKLSLTYHQLRGYLKKYNLLESTESV
jgi:psp operon transcriptional activator